LGVPVVPVGVSERGRLILRFGATIAIDELRDADSPAALVLDRIRTLAEMNSLRDL